MKNLPNPSPRFTGLFIPVEILNNQNLTNSEMLLLAWIDALQCEREGGCYASNSYFAKKLGFKENTISIMITKLKRLGLVKQVSFDGRKRIIKSIKEAWFTETKSKSKKHSDYDSDHTLDLTRIKPYPSPESHPLIYRDKSLDKRRNTPPPNGSGESSAIASELVYFLFLNIKEQNPKCKEPNLKNWAAEMDVLLEDGRDPEEIRRMLNWIASHDFWSTRVLSVASLARSYDTIIAQMKKPKIEKKDPKANDLWTREFVEKNPGCEVVVDPHPGYVEHRHSGKTVSYDLKPRQYRDQFYRLFRLRNPEVYESAEGEDNQTEVEDDYDY
jgi:hypothetical protein